MSKRLPLTLTLSPCEAQGMGRGDSFFTFRGEEGFEESARFGFSQARIDVRHMMAGRLVENARTVLDAAAFPVTCPVINAPNAGEGDRGRAHRAGFQRHVEIAVDQAFAVQHRAGGANRQDFGMGRRVVKLARAVPGQDQDIARGGHDDGSDGHFAAFRRRTRLVER